MTEARNPRDEAERLIASVLGSASVAAEGLDGWATGSAECCVCPVCRAIAAARQPNPNIAERLASGAGDLAQGLASMLRAFSGSFPGGGNVPGGARPESGGTSTATDEDPWHTATRAAAEADAAAAGASDAAAGSAEPAAPPNPPKPMAKKATKPKAPPQPEPDPGEES